MKFNNNLRVKLPYDKSLLPPGCTEEDIKSYYFDEEAGHWKELECATVITETQEIASCTDHFTDMINAVVTVPDAPDPISFNPNEFKEFEAADPGAGVNLIEPPQANNMGDARLSYPIEVPPGRLGMQPGLSMEYNSSGGNGWLGLGWDLPLPAITIDTRWGVPRYLPDFETETYLLNGEQLTPLAHRDVFEPRDGDVKIFHMRVEAEFPRIIRHGTSPNSYWWEVTGKDGTVYYYGGDPGTETLAAESVLTDNDGNIFVWALHEIRDTHGNNIQYRYERVFDTGRQASGPGCSSETEFKADPSCGHNLYPKAIDYTGYNDEPGRYRVEFLRDRDLDEPRRPDVTIDARGGFKRVTGDLLRRIEISYHGSPVRAYELNYAMPQDPAPQLNPFGKTLLLSITQFGYDPDAQGWAPFHTHEFDYYDEIRDPQTKQYLGFSDKTTWHTEDDVELVDLGLTGLGQADASLLSGATGIAIGGNIYAGFNPSSPTKDGSAGFSFAYTHSSTEEDLVLLDINGDNLPDKVFEHGAGFAFRRNQSGPGGEGGFSAGTPYPLAGLRALGEERSDTIGFGPEAYFARASAIFNTSFTFTSSPVYMADVNGDGLPDLVDHGFVWFNAADAGDNVHYSTTSNHSPVPIATGSANIDAFLDELQDLYEQKLKGYPLHDTFRAWVAPFKGIIQITGDVKLAEGENVPTDDGVRVSIELRGQTRWSEDILPGDYSPKTPSGVDNLEINAGERVFFRVQSVFDGTNDRVVWDPEIRYRSVAVPTEVQNPPEDDGNLPPADAAPAPDSGAGDESPPGERGYAVYLPVVQSAADGAHAEAAQESGKPTDAEAEESNPPEGAGDQAAWEVEYVYHDVSTGTDANLLDPFRYQASEDFALAGRRDIHVVMPYEGTVRLEGVLQKTGSTSDDITLVVQVNGEPIPIQTVAWDQIESIPFSYEIDVDEQDTIQLRAKVDSPIDLRQIRWESPPKLYYTECIDQPGGVRPQCPESLTDPFGNPIMQLHPPADIDIYPDKYPAAPPMAWIAPFSGTVRINAQLWTQPLSIFPPDWLDWADWAEWLQGPHTVTFTVKRPGQLAFKHAIVMQPCLFPLPLPLEALCGSVSADVDVLAGDELFFDYSVYDPILGSLIDKPAITVHVSLLQGTWFIAKLASATGLTVDEVIAELSSFPGKTPAQFLEDHGLDVDAFTEAVLADLQARLDQAVADGRIDQSSADLVMDSATQSLHALLTGLIDFEQWPQWPLGPLPVPNMLHTAYRQDHPLLGNGLFAQPYRGWKHAGYNGSGEWADQPIDEARLEIVWDALEFDIPKPPGSAERDGPIPIRGQGFDVTKASAYPFYPYPEEDKWRGMDYEIWIDGGEMVSSRLGVRSIPVPSQDTTSGLQAVPRLSFDDQIAGELGIAFLSGGLSGGSSEGWLDYLDLNGDQFPDVLADLQADRVQYSLPRGDLESSCLAGSCNLASPFRTTSNWAWKYGLGGDVPLQTSNSQGYNDTNNASRPTENESGSLKANLGLSCQRGYSDVDWELADLNGDGLPDRVYREGSSLKVAFNLGYSFAPAEQWGIGQINDGASQKYQLQAGLGWNAGIYDFAGGLTFDRNESRAEEALVDINGDGMPDLVSSSDGNLWVDFNSGTGFLGPVLWPGALKATIGPDDFGVCPDQIIDELVSNDEPRVDLSAEASLGGGVYFTIGIGPLCLGGCYIIINPGVDGTGSLARREMQLVDLNGDGYADHLKSEDDSSIDVAINRTGKTNLLETIRRPLGATIHLEYERQGNTYDMPDSHWVLDKVTLDDGQPDDGVDQQVTTFQYENGIYSRMEREFYGFQKVTEEHINPGDDSVYRTIRREFLNDSYYTRGLLAQEVVEANGDKYLETEYTYFLRDADTGDPAEADDLTARVFPELQRVDQWFYEGQATPGKETHQTYEYDLLGNVTRFVDVAEPLDPQDDLELVITYFDDPADLWIVGIPERIVVSGNAVELRRRAATLDPDTGDMTQMREYLADGSAAVTDLGYDEFGNIVRVTGPANYKGQRYSLAYTYDDQVHTYVTRIEDSFGYVSTASYNFKYGQIEHSTDINSNSTDYTYDQFGRVETIVGPYQTGTGLYTIRFEYHPEAEVPWALTQQIDVYRDVDDPIETAVFMDGLARVIQTKRDAAIHTGVAGHAQDKMIVSGATFFDFVGRPVEQYYPITEHLNNQGEYNRGVDAEAPPTVMAYDVLDRITSTTLPDDTVTQYEYGFGLDRQGRTQFLARVTDANGIPKETYRNVRGLIAAVKEFNNGGSQIIWTSYEYNPLSQIIRVVDDQDNVTQVSYDNLGRRTHLHSPDSGLMETVYDLASNPIQGIPASLRAEGEAILYDYDYNRLNSITYPDFPENNVTYTYGGPGAAHNRANRVVTVSDESGLEEFSYGPLGEIVKTIKTVASDTLGNSPNSPEVYTTEYVYDTWNRLQSLTHPDGEVLTYEYDSGGLVNAASGSKGGWRYEYINRLEYDKFGDPVFTEVGNKMRTSYGYNPLNRCLEAIQAGQGLGSGNLFQDLRLTCDNVGNITAQANLAADRSPSQMGGATQYTYVYDDLNRLVHAKGTFDYEPNKQHRYQLDNTYDTIHNITAKTQRHEIREPSGTLVPQHKTTYDWQYAYDGPQPHAPTHIGEWTFSYDADGNQAGWEHDRNGTRRTIVWDEESRVQSISDSSHTMTYKYNAAGQRVIRRGPQGETVYVNPFFTIRNREVGTKHVYANGMRMVSKLMKQDKPGANPKGKVPLEKDLYFYHPDHLGTSMYVTDAKGDLYEHLEYFPFGETFVEESSNTQRTPYLFTAKELDEETQLYYFGARYYDPQTSVWLSPDPILNEYLSVAGHDAGVYNSRNLQLYGYAEQNPVTYVDFEGRSDGPPRQKRWRRFVNRFLSWWRGGIARKAGRWQGRGGTDYPGVDRWENITIPAGTELLAGEKGRGAFYADYASISNKQPMLKMEAQGNPSAPQYFGLVQVKPRPPEKGLPFRPFLSRFKTKKPIEAARSRVEANPQYGEGGVYQYFIPDWQSVPGFKFPGSKKLFTQ